MHKYKHLNVPRWPALAEKNTLKRNAAARVPLSFLLTSAHRMLGNIMRSSGAASSFYTPRTPAASRVWSQISC